MSNPSKVLIVLPAFNEEASIGGVLTELRTALPRQVLLVVNDGSGDGTAEIAAAAGARVLSMPFNTGVGGAMRAGFRYAVRQGFDTVIQVDADGQHDPADVPLLIEAARAGADVVIGARFAGRGDYEVRGPRKWAMRMLARRLSHMSGTVLTDVTSGFRLSTGPALALFAAEFPEEYLGDTIESLVMASRAGLRIAQVPVAMRDRAGGTPSHSPMKAAIHLARASLVLILARIRRRPQVPRSYRGPSNEGGTM